MQEAVDFSSIREFTDCKERIHTIKTHIETHSLMGSCELKTITDELNQLHKEFCHLETKAYTVNTIMHDFKVHKKTLSSLFGKVHWLSVDREVDKITGRVQNLAENSGSVPQCEVVMNVNLLEKELAMLCHDYRLSWENRGIIRYAKAILKQIRDDLIKKLHQEVIPFAKTTDMIHPSVFEYTSNEGKNMHLLESKGSSVHITEEWEAVETAFDLYEMAHLFYQGKVNDGLKFFNQLSSLHKKNLQKHCVTTHAVLPELSMHENLQSMRMNIIRFIQALIAYANELGKNEESSTPYLSEEEIVTIFDDVAFLSQDSLS